MFTITIHLQATDLHLLEPLARHLGHIEVAIDSPVDPPKPEPRPAFREREIHPAVKMIDRLDRERARKRMIRQEQRVLSPKVIDAVACPECGAAQGKPCGTLTTNFGRSGHTHFERRQAYDQLAKS